jgi:hypothetical protein
MTGLHKEYIYSRASTAAVIRAFHIKYCNMIFTLQKRTVRTIVGVKSKTSCKKLLMSLEIPPLPY